MFDLELTSGFTSPKPDRSNTYQFNASPKNCFNVFITVEIQV